MKIQIGEASVTHSQEQVSMGDTLFSPALSWLATTMRPIVDGQLDLVKSPAHGFLVRWTPSSSRVNPSVPALIELKVPQSEVDSQSIWDFKAALGTNLIVSEAHKAKEPLRTPFFQALMAKGFTVTALQNTSLTDADITLKLAPKVTFRDVTFNASLELVCDELHMTNVSIEGCKITFDVSSGRWANSRVSGDTTQLLGQLGSMVIEGDVIFNDCYIDCDITGAKLMGVDLAPQFGCKVSGGKVPQRVRDLGRPMTEEEFAEMRGRLDSAKWSKIAGGEFVEVSDRTGTGQGGKASALRF